MTLLTDSLPWRVQYASLVDKDGYHFADVDGYVGIEDDEARAALIVRAVNAHEALVAMVEALMGALRDEDDSFDVKYDARKLLASLE